MTSNLISITNTEEYIYCVCGCGELIKKRYKDGKLVRYKQYHTLNDFRYCKKGSEHCKWKGGIWKDKDGYLLLNVNGKRIREHRLVWETYHNCCLLPWAIIHHINGVKDDNTIENLQAIPTQGIHLINHTSHRKIPKDRICSECGSNKTYSKPNKYPEWHRHENGFLCDKCNCKYRYHKRQEDKTKKKKK